MLTRQPVSRIPFIASLLLLLIADSAAAGVYFVRSTGSDSNSGKNRNSAFKSIQKALSKAKGNDIVYIGAGTYTEAISKNYGKKPGSIQIFGDIKGSFTGDKGVVTIEVPTNRWGLRIDNANTVTVNNIHFIGVMKDKRSYACFLNNVANYAYFGDCSFETLGHGIYTYKARYSYAKRCSFKNMVYCNYFRESAIALNYESNYEDFSQAVYYVDVSLGYTYACDFFSGSGAGNYPIRAYRSGTYVVQSTFTSPTYGIYGQELTLLEVSNCQFRNPSAYAVYATGRKLAASNITVQGAGEKKGWGLMLADTSGGKANLSNVSLSGLNGGIVAAGSDYNFQKTSSTSNRIGLYVERRTPSMSIDENSDVTFDDNDYAIYAVHNNQDFPGQLTIRNQTIANNTYGLYAQETDIRLENCNFINNAYGARAVNTNEATITRCQFRDNVARVVGTHYGLYVSAEKTSVTDLVSVNNYNGLMIQNLSDQEPELRNLEITDNEYMGIWLRDGSVTLSNTEVLISNSRYGLYAYRANMNLSNISLPTDCDYPIYNFEAELNLAGGDIGQGKIGVYSVRSPSVTIRDTRVQNQKQHGLYLVEPQSVSLTGCESSGNGSHGLYCSSPSGSQTVFQVEDSTFSNNTYGFRTIGIPFDMDHARNVTISGNNHGLRIERAQLWLKPEMNITLKDNRYAAMSYYGNMNVENVAIIGNDYGLYTWQSKLQATGTELAANLYGIICYTGDSELRNVHIHDSTYGVYFSARDDQGDTLTIRDSKIENSNIGIYGRTNGNISQLNISNTQISGGNNGVYGYQVKMAVSQVTTTDTKSYGIYQLYGSGTFDDVTIDGAGSWGMVAYGDSTIINRARINSKYGLYLRPLYARVVNSVIRDSVYGIYTNNPDGDFEVFQTTIGNISHYGMLHNSGRAVLRNSIVDADVVALWNRSSSGSLTHDHNLVYAERQSYVNELPGEAEIEKQPIFLDPQAGDLHLAEGSPAINAGIDLAEISATDIEGNIRPSFRQFELGAFEYTKADGSLRVLDWVEKAQ